MKLLIISGDTALAQGKKGPFYYTLEEFSKHFDRIDIICPKTRQKISQVHGNVFIHSSKKSRIFQSWFILKKGQEIYKKEKFDAFGVQSYPPFYNDIGARWLFNKIKVPYLLEIMHIVGHPKAANLKEWLYRILTKLFIKFSAKKAKAVRVINKTQVLEFLEKARVDKNKIQYVPAFYIDFNVFKPSFDSAQDKQKKYDLVFSGRLAKNKGIDLLLGAIKILKSQIQNIKLIIIGTGPLENKIKKYIKKNNLENNIEFSGWVSTTNDVARIYNQSEIMVMPSYNEGGPRVCLEAMACKVPVITSKVGIMLDIIQDKENGLFIDWKPQDIADKIKLLLNDKELKEKIAKNGYEAIQQFERKKAIEKYAQTYKNLLYSA